MLSYKAKRAMEAPLRLWGGLDVLLFTSITRAKRAEVEATETTCLAEAGAARSVNGRLCAGRAQRRGLIDVTKRRSTRGPSQRRTLACLVVGTCGSRDPNSSRGLQRLWAGLRRCALAVVRVARIWTRPKHNALLRFSFISSHRTVQAHLPAMFELVTK